MGPSRQDQDPTPDRPAHALGATSGVSVSQTWILVFERNEAAEAADKLTDSQISEFMKGEFPGLDAVTFDRVEIARGKYNRGGFHKKDAKGRVVRPTIRSHQHGIEDDARNSTRNPSKRETGPMTDRIIAHKKDFKSHKK